MTKFDLEKHNLKQMKVFKLKRQQVFTVKPVNFS